MNTSDKDLTEERAREAAAQIEFWLNENQVWLTDWLTNVVTIHPVEAKMFPAIFGTIVSPVPISPPEELIVAGNAMKFALIKSKKINNIFIVHKI